MYAILVYGVKILIKELNILLQTDLLLIASTSTSSPKIPNESIANSNLNNSFATSAAPQDCLGN